MLVFHFFHPAPPNLWLEECRGTWLQYLFDTQLAFKTASLQILLLPHPLDPQTLLYATLPSTEAAQVVAQVVWDLSQVLEGIPRAATLAFAQPSAAKESGAGSQGQQSSQQTEAASADADDGWSTAGGRSGSKGGNAGKRGAQQQQGSKQQQQRANGGVVPGAGEDALRGLAKRALSYTVAAMKVRKGDGIGAAIGVFLECCSNFQTPYWCVF